MQDMQPQEPEMNQQAGAMPPTDDTHDQEGAMAKADLYKLANYSFKLFKKLEDDAQLEAWVQAKITKAADYIASVYHYLEYEMEFSEYGSKIDNSEMYSESQKRAIKGKLMEAKGKVAELKKLNAEKLKDKKKVEEGIFGGHEQSCTECGGTGMIQVPERPVPEHVKSKVEKYNRQAKAFHAASKRIDKNKNGIPDALEGDEEVEEDQSNLKKTGDTFKTRTGVASKTSTGVKHTNTSHKDDEYGEPPSKVKARSAADKAGEKAMDKAQEKDYKAAKKANPEGVRRYSLGKQVDAPGQKKEKEVDETYGQGVYEGKGKKPDFLDMDKDGNKKEPMKKAVADKKKNPFAKKVDEAKKEKEPEGTYSSKRHETDGQRIARLAKEKRQAQNKERMKNDYNAEMEREGIEEALKGKQKKLDADKDGDIEADDLAALRAKKDKKVAESSAAAWKAKSKSVVKEAIAKVRNEGAFDAIGKAASAAGTAMGFDTEDNLAKKSPQLQQLIALRKSPEYANDPAKMKSLEDRITKQKDRVSLDKGEVMDQSGKPVAVNESADLTRMKEFLTRLNG